MDIMWHDARSLRSLRSKRLEGSEALRAHLGADIEVGRHCPSCGSTTHGRPWARLADGTSTHVSLSRCGEHLVTVVAEHPVGIDVESIEAVTSRWDPALVLHPSEKHPHDLKEMRRLAHDLKEMRGPAHDLKEMRLLAHDLKEMRQRGAMWCRKEAILKALGTGLSTPMSEIRVADWPVVDIEAPGGLAAAVATIPQAGRGGSSTS
ncbi:4'-phosphopantetheinyl transferase superfamily protein [Janibacter limosus]|uniref:4'-phosphopantetheinyl transferase superfamily protein n=2 Tax=Janibacter limosus TaxID=53458 RepID=A0A4P6MXQ9_9MICO|nr:4'-phosphopantetheinyl transferase superfamily protein [Janibacter limosus]